MGGTGDLAHLIQQKYLYIITVELVATGDSTTVFSGSRSLLHLQLNPGLLTKLTAVWDPLLH